MPPTGPGQRPRKSRSQNGSQSVSLPGPSLAEQKDTLRQALLGHYATATEVGNTLRGLAKGQLGFIAGNTMAAQSQVRNQIATQLAPIQSAANDAANSAKAQLMGQLGNVFSQAQTAVPDFPDASQLASEIYPNQAAAFATSSGPMNNDPSACLAAALQAYQAALYALGPLYQTDPQEYARRAYALQQQYMQTVIGCNAGMGGQAPGGGVGLNPPQGKGGPGGTGGVHVKWPGGPGGPPLPSPLPWEPPGGKVAGPGPVTPGPAPGGQTPGGGPGSPGGPGGGPYQPGPGQGYPGQPTTPGGPGGGGYPGGPTSPGLPGGPAPGSPGSPGGGWPPIGPPITPGGPPVISIPPIEGGPPPPPPPPPAPGPPLPGGPPSIGGTPCAVTKDGQSLSADDIVASIVAGYGNWTDLFARTAWWSDTFGIPVVLRTEYEGCPPGFVSVWSDMGNLVSPPVQFCIQCASGSTKPPATDPKCCPPTTINVTCAAPAAPPPTSPPTVGINVWQTSEGLCYVLTADKPARRPTDSLLSTDATASGLTLPQLQNLCTQKGPPPEENGGGPQVPGFIGVNACTEMLQALGIPQNNNNNILASFFGLVNADGTLKPRPRPTGLSVVDNLLYAANSFVIRSLDQMSAWIYGFLRGAPCQSPEYISLAITQLLAGVVDKWIGPGMESVLTPAQQNARYICPLELPGGDKAIEAYLTNQVDLATAICWARADNQKEVEWKTMLRSRQTRYNPGEAIALWLRDKLTEAQCDTALREAGYLDAGTAANLKALAQQIPPASDLVSLMQRDAADVVNINWNQEDALFPQKFAGKIKEWAKNQGVSEEYMQLLWRAHFSIPSPTQLYEMLHRLSRLPAGNAAAVNLQDVKNALIQQDISPKWVEQFVAISYRPLTRIDVRRAYNLGTLSDDEFVEAYLQLGYDTQNADRLLKFVKDEKQKKLYKDPIVKAYQLGLVNRSTVEQILIQKGATHDTPNKAMAEADLARTIERRKICHTAWKKRYLTGEYELPYARQLLIQDGLDADVANEIINGWQCQKVSRGKQIPAATLCKWFSDGLIDSGVYFSRLVKVGYAENDALAIVNECELRLNIQRSKAAEKAIKAEVARQKAQSAAQRQAAADAAKASDKQTAALDKARGIRKRRRGLVLEIAFEFAKTSGVDPSTAVEEVEGISQLITQQGPYPLDSVLEAGVRVAKSPTVETVELLAAEWLQVMAGLGGDSRTL